MLEVYVHSVSAYAMQMGACKRMAVQLDATLWQRGAAGDRVTQMETSGLGVTWHGAAKGASLVGTYHATLSVDRTASCKIPGPHALNINEDKVAFLNSPLRVSPSAVPEGCTCGRICRCSVLISSPEDRVFLHLCSEDIQVSSTLAAP